MSTRRVRWGRASRVAVAVSTVSLWVGLGCSSQEIPRVDPGSSDAVGGGTTGGAGAAGATGCVEPELPTGCGTAVVPLVVKRPLLYFVLDRSGSMSSDLVEGKPKLGTRWEAAREGVLALARELGPTIRYGAALFPGAADGQCSPGSEIFEPTDGDSRYCAPDGEGEVYRAFRLQLTGRRPDGGTPTSSALNLARASLTELAGERAVVLATDGAANCNEAARCSGEDCEPDRRKTASDLGICGVDLACCDPAVFADGPRNCIDRDATVTAVRALAVAGIRTYVIGLASNGEDEGPYRTLLEEIATAGGTARATGTKFYPADSTEELQAALAEIGRTVARSCLLPLGNPPKDATLVNVYLDYIAEPAANWKWKGGDSIELVGDACARVKAGSVAAVQVAFGCPTVIR